MSVKDDLIADVNDVFLDIKDFADTITVDSVSVAAIVTLNEQIQTIDAMDGRGCQRTGVLFLSTDVVITEGSTVVLPGSSDEWKVLGSPSKDTRGGQRATIVRWEQTEKSGRNFRIQR